MVQYTERANRCASPCANAACPVDWAGRGGINKLRCFTLILFVWPAVCNRSAQGAEGRQVQVQVQVQVHVAFAVPPSSIMADDNGPDNTLGRPLLARQFTKTDTYIAQKLQKTPSMIERERSGTVLNSIFTLVSTIVGGGSLSLPYAFACTGLAIGALLAFFASARSLFCCALIAACLRACVLATQRARI
jgi:hypothetical protein